ncbi:hypothetical protein FHQ18_06125 [Deferribacter autotrophicus]|uniref:Uncharacterized protein n=1 Tax=Deferribacter autotrophicus TaxID=500465 RepID=A0A5A8F795_9BACT|nr:hypothetical protein [Deferribacter autotrophicus]KAA0257967.1 hypothetical protein FHQ18_06125 [Deferribacter autotrophicus]
MDVKFIPSITIPVINNKTSTNKTLSTSKLRLKGKILNIRSARKEEPGKYVITIIVNDYIQNYSELSKKNALIIID